MEEKIGKKTFKSFKKTKKSTYDGYKQFVNLFNLVENGNIKQTPTSSIDKISIKTSFVEKSNDVDRSTLYSFDGPFQLLHADVGNLLNVYNQSKIPPSVCQSLLFKSLYT